MTKTGLAQHAYAGPPRGVSHVWPDEVLQPSQWDRNHWSYDEVLRTHARREAKPSFTRDTAMDLLNKLLCATK